MELPQSADHFRHRLSQDSSEVTLMMHAPDNISALATWPMLVVKPYLSLPVNPNDAGGGLVWRSYKDGFAADAVHVDAGACLQVVQVDVSIFGDEENHVLFGAYLRRRGKKVNQISASATTTTLIHALACQRTYIYVPSWSRFLLMPTHQMYM